MGRGLRVRVWGQNRGVKEKNWGFGVKIGAFRGHNWGFWRSKLGFGGHSWGFVVSIGDLRSRASIEGHNWGFED